MTDSDIQNIEKTCKGFIPPVDRPKRKKFTKTEKLLKLLNSKRGATIQQLQETSGWQAHSVRGFLSGTVKNKLDLALVSATGKDGRNRYRIENGAAGQ